MPEEMQCETAVNRTNGMARVNKIALDTDGFYVIVPNKGCF